jgi:hypothetical protein
MSGESHFALETSLGASPGYLDTLMRAFFMVKQKPSRERNAGE